MPTGKNGNGLTLLEHFIPDGLSHAATAFVESLKINSMSEERRGQWLPFTTCFIKAYADRDVVEELRRRLVVPNGLALVWWNVRTNFAKKTKVKRRLGALRNAIGKLQLYRFSPAKRARKRRRPSTSCQKMSPGIPRPSSRRRVIRERAKAASPGMPSKLPTRT